MGNYSNYLHSNLPGMVFKGNPVISRNGYLPTSAFLRTYIDANAQLSQGLLKEIMFYTHGIDTAPTPGMNRLRVQIWKPVGNAGDNEYELVWEYHEQELEIGPIGVLWKVRLILSYRGSKGEMVLREMVGNDTTGISLILV